MSRKVPGAPPARLAAGRGMGEGMRDQDGQLSLFCRGCCGSGAVLVDVPNHDGDPVLVPAPCPVCRPHPARPETWLAAVKLGRRLVREQAAGPLQTSPR